MPSIKDVYPKTYCVPFISSESVTEALIACYSLVKADLFRQEVTVIAMKAKSLMDSIKFSINPVVLTLTPASELDINDFIKSYNKHQSGISAVVALDKKDRLRVSITLPAEDAAKKAGVPVTPVVMVYDAKTDAEIECFFSKWKEAFDNSKNSYIPEQKTEPHK